VPAFLASLASCWEAKTLTMGIGASGFLRRIDAKLSIHQAGHVEIHEGEVGIDRVMLLDGFTANLPVGLYFD
jgi:hypothetical protein